MNKKGFTIIEMLVVIVIIGILSVSVFVFLRSARAKGRDSSRKEELRQIQNALTLYIDDNGSYPALLDDIAPQYIAKIPKDPTTQNSYPYKSSATGNFYELNALLELNIDKAADIDGGNQPFPVYEIGNDLTLLP